MKPFNAHTLLDSSTEYYVTVDKGFIKFTDGTVNAAITKEMWTFQTEMLTTTADVTIKASDDVTTDISVDWTDSWFQNKTSTYCHELAIASIALSSSAYVESGGEPASDSVEAALQDFGFDVEAYNYDYPLSDDDNDVVSFTFGEKNYEDTKLIAIIIKGTSGNEEWYSNFNISASKSDSNADHTGFRLAADDLIEQLGAYLDTLGNIDKSRIKFYVTGHSRGAGVANLVAATLTDKYTQNNVFAYTFAAPTVSKNATENGYENIYNIINEEDFVTQIPLSTWGFGRYGIDLALPSRSWKGKSYSTLAAKRDATYTSLIGEDYAEYLCGTFNVRCLVSAVNNLAPSVYAYYYLKHAFVYNSIYLWETTSGYFGNLAALLVGDSSLAYTYFVPSELGSYAPVTTFFLWSHKIRGQVFAAHSMAGYYSWMSSCTAEELFEDPQSSTYKTFKSLTVACPVDVYVYDESGELVASIVDEEIVVDELALNVEDGVKTIDLSSDQEYTVEVIAREDGEMDYVVEELSAEATGDTVLRTVTFSDVSIEEKDSFVGQIDSEFDASSTNYALTVNDSEIIYDDSVTYVKDIPNQTYTGSAITPEPVVVNGATVLEKGKDYTVTYKNNTRIGTATITIKGKGNYTKTITASFEITPQNLASTAITATAADKVTTATVLDSDGALLTKWYSYPTLKNGTATLRRGTDYTVDGFTVANDDAENAYTVTVTLSGIGNYTRTREVTYRITGKSISGVVTTAVAAQTYTGSALEPEIAVYANSAEKNAENPLAEGTDYTVEYENNIAVGTGKLILTGIGVYSGTKTITFRIDKKGLAASKTDTDEITVLLSADGADWKEPSEYSAQYSGSAQKPYVQVICTPSGSEGNDAVTLVEGTDYRLSWKNNVNAVQTTTKSSSYPTVTITGLGNYSGSRSVTFEIAPLELTEDNTEITVSDVQYTAAVGRSGAKPSVTVKVTLDGGDTWTTLKSGTAYTVASYADNTSVGTDAKVYIAGKGNYTTTEPVEKTFHIYESAASSLYVTVTAPTENSGMVYTGAVIEPTVSVYKNKTDQRNKTNALTENTDYTVSYANNIDAGSSAQVLVSGLGTYGGTKTVTFRIARQSLVGGSVNPYADESSSYTYTGSAISLTETQLSVTDSNDRELILGTDYTVSYRNNTNAGTAQITVTGKGNYSGSLKGSFTISPLTLTDENTTISVSDVKYTAAIGRSGAKPTVTVKVTTDAGKTLTLKKNTAYTVSYSGNKEIGSATVSITGKGNFGTEEGSEPSEQFCIYKNAASSLYVVLEDSPYYYSGSQIKPTISVYTKRGGVLVDESCYTVEYGTNTNIGTGKIYITGVGDYGGTKTVNFTILPKWLKWFL
ncbi:MAG: lipase family protein [Lachnospiraceae bacterium]|nr:lipase family protein [Lachnospiraceae bacterium]